MGFSAIIEDECLLALYGDGYDGDVTISSPVTLTRDMYYDNLTLAAGAALTCTGVRVRVRNTLDISAAPAGAIISNGEDGGDASGAVGGTGLGDYYRGLMVSIAHGFGGISGKTGTTGAGTITASQYANVCFGGIKSGRSGGGGTGSGGAGGGARPACNDSLVGVRHPFPEWAVLWSASGHVEDYPIYSGHGGQGGGSGGGDGVNSGGGGGAGGNAGGIIFLAARTIARGSNETASIIKALGGSGGDGGTPAAGNCGGGGGGGGGAGGAVVIICQNKTGSVIADAVDVTGGDGGDGSVGTGTGTAGAGGYGGGKGNLWQWDGANFSVSVTGAEQANSGTTGGTGESGLIDL